MHKTNLSEPNIDLHEYFKYLNRYLYIFICMINDTYVVYGSKFDKRKFF